MPDGTCEFTDKAHLLSLPTQHFLVLKNLGWLLTLDHHFPEVYSQADAGPFKKSFQSVNGLIQSETLTVIFFCVVC